MSDNKKIVKNMGSIIKHKKYKEQCKLCISELILFIGSVVAGGTKKSRADTRGVGGALRISSDRETQKILWTKM